jgi:hypothetical protein
MSDQPVLLVRWLIVTSQNGSSFVRLEFHNLFSVVNRLFFSNFRLCDTFILSTHAICVCVYVCMYLCMYACKYVCTYLCTYVCMYVSTYVSTYVRMYVCMYFFIFIVKEHAPLHWVILHAVVQINTWMN